MKLHELFESEKTFADVIGDMTGQTSEMRIEASNIGITSLKGAPKIVKDNFFAIGNKLTSLEFAPEIVYGQFSCSNNEITSFHNVHKQIKEVHGEFFVSRNPLKSHVLGVLLIKGVTAFLCVNPLYSTDKKMNELEQIVCKYLPNTRGNDAIFECQQELIDAGLDEYAQL